VREASRSSRAVGVDMDGIQRPTDAPCRGNKSPVLQIFFVVTECLLCNHDVMGRTSTAISTAGTQSGLGKFTSKFPLFTKVALVLTWLIGPYFAAHGVYFAVLNRNPGIDAHAYWLAGRGPVDYSRVAGEIDAYLYSPAFATAVRPLAALDWPFFFAAWVVLQGSLLAWLLKPLPFRWSIPIFLLCVPELVNANIFILLAASAVIGTRYPVSWAFPLLTKITSGVGLFWYAARREWMNVAKILTFTAAIAAVSYILTPNEWQAWFHFLLSNSGGTQDGTVSFVLRCLAAVMTVMWGAKKNLHWVMAPAMVLASPVFALPTLTLLAAIPRLSAAGSRP